MKEEDRKVSPVDEIFSKENPNRKGKRNRGKTRSRQPLYCATFAPTNKKKLAALVLALLSNKGNHEKLQKSGLWSLSRRPEPDLR